MPRDLEIEVVEHSDMGLPIGAFLRVKWHGRGLGTVGVPLDERVAIAKALGRLGEESLRTEVEELRKRDAERKAVIDDALCAEVERLTEERDAARASADHNCDRLLEQEKVSAAEREKSLSLEAERDNLWQERLALLNQIEKIRGLPEDADQPVESLPGELAAMRKAFQRAEAEVKRLRGRIGRALVATGKSNHPIAVEVADILASRDDED